MTQLAMHDDPPPFGHEMLKYFAFDPDYVNLNHGSYGSLPLPVLAACNELTLRIESNPDLFVRVDQPPLITHCRTEIADFVHAKPSEIVLVRNTSHGLNTILRSFDWREGDILVTCSTTYDAMQALARFIRDTPPQPTVSIFALQFPTTHAALLDAFAAHLNGLPRHSGQKVVALIDSITSVPGALMPWQAMVRLCKDAGVYSVIDGAHSIGQEPNINLGQADPDFWVSNCHKWLFAKRGCAVMFVPERNQGIVKSSFPTSKVYVSPQDRAWPGESFEEQYYWNGTIDFVPPLSISAALQFRQWLGGEEKIGAYCRSLARRGGARLAEVWGTRVMDDPERSESGGGEWTLNMVNVQLPLPPSVLPSDALGALFTRRMLTPEADSGSNEKPKKVSAGVFYHNGAWWVRCSTQVWNELRDFELLGRVLGATCEEIVGMEALGDLELEGPLAPETQKRTWKF
ncbi:pyridoxal phosphate-dependent transferase [Mycena galericulata]|nr:pyridoxal phosphate-dependent transferase [Mycena galericulata]